MAINYRYGDKNIELLQYLEERIRGNPASTFFAMLAYFYLQIDKVAEALSVAQRGVIAHPNYSTGHVVLAMAMERARLFTDAKKELLKAQDLHPGSKIVERLIGELEKNEQADEIGKKLAEQYRKNRDKDIMKTVEESIEANRSKPSTDDFVIPGLDVIIGEKLLKVSSQAREQELRPIEPPSDETDFTKAFSDHITPKEEASPKVTNGSNIAKAIIDKVVREVEAKNLPLSEQASSGQDLESQTQTEPSIGSDKIAYTPNVPEMEEGESERPNKRENNLTWMPLPASLSRLLRSSPRKTVRVPAVEILISS